MEKTDCVLKTQAKLEFYKDDHLKARVACERFEVRRLTDFNKISQGWLVKGGGRLPETLKIQCIPFKIEFVRIFVYRGP